MEMSLRLGLSMVPELRMGLRQTMHKECDNCGETTDMGEWIRAYGQHSSCTSAVCWSCGLGLYPKVKGTTIVISKGECLE